MSEFRGLHNPDRHQTTNEAGEAWCEICAEDCDEKNGTMFHCPCCLAAEVEALRATVQAVREACDEHNARTVWGGDGQTWSVVDRDAILRILDGGDA